MAINTDISIHTSMVTNIHIIMAMVMGIVNQKNKVILNKNIDCSF